MHLSEILREDFEHILPIIEETSRCLLERTSILSSDYLFFVSVAFSTDPDRHTSRNHYVFLYTILLPYTPVICAVATGA